MKSSYLLATIQAQACSQRAFILEVFNLAPSSTNSIFPEAANVKRKNIRTDGALLIHKYV